MTSILLDIVGYKFILVIVEIDYVNLYSLFLQLRKLRGLWSSRIVWIENLKFFPMCMKIEI